MWNIIKVRSAFDLLRAAFTHRLVDVTLDVEGYHLHHDRESSERTIRSSDSFHDHDQHHYAEVNGAPPPPPSNSNDTSCVLISFIPTLMRH